MNRIPQNFRPAAPLTSSCGSLLAVLAFGAGAIIWLGIYPKPLIDAIEAASRALLN